MPHGDGTGWTGISSHEAVGPGGVPSAVHPGSAR